MRHRATIQKAMLKNFRSFGKKQEARLAPLTLLVGENSTGKTSFLAAIRALCDIALQGITPDFKKEPYDLGSFEEASHSREENSRPARIMELGFEYSLYQRIHKSERAYQFEVEFKKRGAMPSPVKRRISQNDVWFEHRQSARTEHLVMGTPRGVWEKEYSIGNFVSRNRDIERLGLLMFTHTNSEMSQRIAKWTSQKGPKSPSKEDYRRMEELRRALGRPGLLLHPHLGKEVAFAGAPVRFKPYRTYNPTRVRENPEGEYIPMYLADLSFRNKKLWGKLQSSLRKFGKDSGLFHDVSVKSWGNNEGSPFQIQIQGFDNSTNPQKSPRRNLIDVGYGVSQVLPVITELLSFDAPPLFLLQQPEVHLHPSAQAALGTLFCEVSGPERQLIVETHSDHLLDRVRMDVRDKKGKLKPKDVSILFFERTDAGVVIHSLEIDEKGNIKGAPPGYRKFFLEETNRSLDL